MLTCVLLLAASGDGRHAASVDAVATCLSQLCSGHRVVRLGGSHQPRPQPNPIATPPQPNPTPLAHTVILSPKPAFSPRPNLRPQTPQPPDPAPNHHLQPQPHHRPGTDTYGGLGGRVSCGDALPAWADGFCGGAPRRPAAPTRPLPSLPLARPRSRLLLRLARTQRAARRPPTPCTRAAARVHPVCSRSPTRLACNPVHPACSMRAASLQPHTSSAQLYAPMHASMHASRRGGTVSTAAC